MGLKNGEAALAADWAIRGWVTYVQQVTRDLAADHPVDERMMLALAGEELPVWLEEGVRVHLVAARSSAQARLVSATG